APPRGGLLRLGTIRGPVPPIVGIALTGAGSLPDVQSGTKTKTFFKNIANYGNPPRVPKRVGHLPQLCTPLKKTRNSQAQHSVHDSSLPALDGRTLNFSLLYPVAYFIVTDNNNQVIYLVKVGVDTLRFLGG
ncbi:hypothetical protein J6590_106369, partial [Homalodisca vitripennis]